MKIKKNMIFLMIMILLAINFCFLANTKAKTILATTQITTDDLKPGTIDVGSFYVTNTEELIIEDVVAEDKFSAYKILDTYYNKDTNIITYQFTESFESFLNDSNTSLTVQQYSDLTSGSYTDGSVTTESTLDKLISKYASYVKSNEI